MGLKQFVSIFTVVSFRVDTFCPVSNKNSIILLFFLSMKSAQITTKKNP